MKANVGSRGYEMTEVKSPVVPGKAVSLEVAIERLYGILSDQVRKLLQGGWPAAVVLMAFEKVYITLLTTSSLGLNGQGARTDFVMLRLNIVSQEVGKETRLAILRGSVPTTKTQQ